MYAGLGCAECGGTCTAPKGMGTIDLSTATWEDWLLVGIVGAVFFTVAFPDSSVVTGKKKRKRPRKRVSAGSGFAFGTVLTLALVGGAGYLIYSSNS